MRTRKQSTVIVGVLVAVPLEFQNCGGRVVRIIPSTVRIDPQVPAANFILFLILIAIG